MNTLIEEKESKKSRETAERYMVDANKGLSDEQVRERTENGLVNNVDATGGKTVWQITRRNLFSFFNILLYIIAIAMIVVKNFGGLFFVVILVANSGIGLFQDFRAQKQLKKLQIVAASRSTVIREGEKTEILVSALVLDDIVVLKQGNQIPADSVVVEGTLAVNESLLTGESTTIKKQVGARLLGGSYVTSGTAKAQVDRVGDDTYINKLQEKAKIFKRPKSRLLSVIDGLFRLIGIVVIVLGIIMIIMGIINKEDPIKLVTRISGSLVSMIPSGMYLLTSMTIAVSIINLAKRNTLAQESYAIEMLARTDVLCIDKTGTITDGSMKLKDVVPIKNFDVSQLSYVMGSFLRVTKDVSPTTNALKNAYPENNLYLSDNFVPFSSERKNSAVTFEGIGTYILGAANFVLDAKAYEEIRALEEDYMSRGLRVLLLAHTDKPIKDDVIPKKAKPLVLFIIQDRVRPYVGDTFDWFRENGVEIKVISGDHPTTVAEICNQVGVEGADRSISLAGLSDAEVAEAALANAVFGRVSPEQKEIIVKTLQSDGKTVAMVGDGVNDILALKNAECSIAMGNGAEATQAVSHIVLVDNDFNSLPEIVKEGRRVINNLQRTWSLFLVKTIFAIILTIVFLISNKSYPFVTQNMYIWETATIGISAFFLSMQPNYHKVEGSFNSNVTKRSLPAAITMVLLVLSIFVMFNFEADYPGSTKIASEEVAITMATITMSVFSFIILFRISWPFNRYRIILFTVILGVTAVILTLVGVSHLEDMFFKIDFSLLNSTNIWTIVITLVVGIMLYWVLDRAFGYPLRSSSEEKNI